MIRSIFLVIAASTFGFLVAAEPERPTPRTPVLVELFTSEGCSSCPPADRLLVELDRMQPVEGVEIFVLSEHVDYWNRLGWVDPFSSKLFSKRQSWYSMRWPTRVYTPQAIVDGRTEFVGSDGGLMRKAIQAAAREPKGRLDIRAGEILDDRLRVAVDAPDTSKREFDVYLVLVEDGLASDVKRGENQGRRIEHAGVVRVLEKLGASTAGASFDHLLELEPGWDRSKLRLIAFAQDQRTRRIVALGALELPI